MAPDTPGRLTAPLRFPVTSASRTTRQISRLTNSCASAVEAARCGGGGRRGAGRRGGGGGPPPRGTGGGKGGPPPRPEALRRGPGPGGRVPPPPHRGTERRIGRN